VRRSEAGCSARPRRGDTAEVVLHRSAVTCLQGGVVLGDRRSRNVGRVALVWRRGRCVRRSSHLQVVHRRDDAIAGRTLRRPGDLAHLPALPPPARWCRALLPPRREPLDPAVGAGDDHCANLAGSAASAESGSISASCRSGRSAPPLRRAGRSSVRSSASRRARALRAGVGIAPPRPPGSPPTLGDPTR
jgi:hypothetical protein